MHAFGGAKNHMVIMPDADMDKTVDALIGAGYGSAGQRCMAISVAVPVGAMARPTKLMEKLDAARRSPEDRPLDRRLVPTTARSCRPKPPSTRSKMYTSRLGLKEGATLAVDGRGFKMQGYEKGFYHRRRACSTT